MADPVAAPEVQRIVVPWQRIREPAKSFSNVPTGSVSATTTVYLKIPRYPRTILGIILQLGGTTLTKALLSRIELKLGEVSIWGPVSGTEVDAILRYENAGGPNVNSDYMLPIMFTLPNVKEMAGEFIGGIDLSTLPDGDLVLEVDIASGASSPTLLGHMVWGAPQYDARSPLAGQMMQKLRKITFPQQPAGMFYPTIDSRGALVLRHFFFSSVANSGSVAAFGSGASNANTGTGSFGTATVDAREPTGIHTIKVIEPGANAGTFLHFDVNGRVRGSGNIAVAYNAGINFNIANNTSTNFVSGDGWKVTVLPRNEDQNIVSVVVKKNELTWWSRTDRAARFEQQMYGRQPLSQLYVADFVIDNHTDSWLDTRDAVQLDYELNLTAADTISVVTQSLALPIPK